MNCWGGAAVGVMVGFERTFVMPRVVVGRRKWDGGLMGRLNLEKGCGDLRKREGGGLVIVGFRAVAAIVEC